METARTRPTCKTCIGFGRFASDKPTGACRKNPPTVVILGMVEQPITGRKMPQTVGFFPPVSETDWCASHVLDENGPLPLPTIAQIEAAVRLAEQSPEGTA